MQVMQGVIILTSLQQLYLITQELNVINLQDITLRLQLWPLMQTLIPEQILQMELMPVRRTGKFNGGWKAQHHAENLWLVTII